MNKIKVTTRVDEHNKIAYQRTFEIKDSLPEIGDVKHEEWEVTEIREAHIDFHQSNDETHDYDYFEVVYTRREDGERDIEYIAVHKPVYDEVVVKKYLANMTVFLSNSKGMIPQAAIDISTDGITIGDGEDDLTIEECVEGDMEQYFSFELDYDLSEKAREKLRQELEFYYASYR